MKRHVISVVICVVLMAVSTARASETKYSKSSDDGFPGAYHHIVDTYTFPGFKVIQFTLPVLSVYSYMLVSDGEALMVDPVRDISFYLETAKKEGVKIKGVYLTHSHADFVAGHTEMVAARGCPIYQSHRSGVAYPIEAMDESSVVKIGRATLKFIDTPGHTPDGMCCAVYADSEPRVPKALFTGDVLFVGSVGRPDLMGGTASAALLAGATYDSWTNKLSKLPDDVVVLPGHGAGSFCGTRLSSDPSTTIGKERKTNQYLKFTKRGEFIAAVLQGLPPAPQYFSHTARMNRQGPPRVDWGAPTPSPQAPSMELTDVKKCSVVDLRDDRSYGGGHIPNSLNISAMGRLENWVGTMVPWGVKVLLVGDSKVVKRAISRLHRVGYRAGVVDPDQWKRAGLPIETSEPTEPKALSELMKKGVAPLIVDVRKPSEWKAERIGTVLNLPLNRLTKHAALLDPDKPLVAYCTVGYRSSMAVGLLERKGFKHATSLAGGIERWAEEKLPLVKEKKD